MLLTITILSIVLDSRGIVLLLLLHVIARYAEVLQSMLLNKDINDSLLQSHLAQLFKRRLHALPMMIQSSHRAPYSCQHHTLAAIFNLASVIHLCLLVHYLAVLPIQMPNLA